MNKKTPYDHSYKLLFSEPAMVKDLLVGFFAENWINELDFDTLQRINKEYVTETLRERESDVVWKVQWKDQWLYVLILIEFQSSIDPFMVVRMLSYVSLLYQDIIKEDSRIRKSGKLPPILPLVLYNGRIPWNAPTQFNTLIPDNLPKMLRKFQPEFTYWLLDEGHYIIEDVESDNLIAPLIALEQSHEAKDILETVNRLVKQLKEPTFDSIRRAYTVYLRRILRAKEIAPDLEINELHEVQHMLSERVEIWKQRAIAEGRAEGQALGKAEGKAEGITCGERAIVSRLLTKRFGPLNAEQTLILNNMSAEALLDISDRLLDAKSIDEIIEVR